MGWVGLGVRCVCFVCCCKLLHAGTSTGCEGASCAC
jgi:hypothetical protein